MGKAVPKSHNRVGQSIINYKTMIFTTGRGSIYYYSKQDDIAVRFKYASGKVYFLPFPDSLSFEKAGTFLCCIPTTDMRDTPAVGYTPFEDFGTGRHQGHEVTGVDVRLNDNENAVIRNLRNMTKGHIYNMTDLFDNDDYSKGAKITNDNQAGRAYDRA